MYCKPRPLGYVYAAVGGVDCSVRSIHLASAAKNSLEDVVGMGYASLPSTWVVS